MDTIRVLVLVGFHWFFFIKEANCNFVEVNVSDTGESAIKINTRDQLHLRITLNNTNKQKHNGSCSGKCNVLHNTNESKNVLLTFCQIVNEDYINVFTNETLTYEYEGLWDCSIKINPDSKSNNSQNDNISTKFYVAVEQDCTTPPLAPTSYQNWPYIIAAAAAMLILIIFIQAGFIIRYRRKAKEVKRHTHLSNFGSSAAEDDTARYSQTPGLRRKMEICAEARESGIYEALDNVRERMPAPEPPPLDTLPHNDPVKTRAPSTSSNTSTIPRTLTNTAMQFFTNSLTKKKTAQKETGSESKRSTLERIKERPRLPLPNEEVYEVMDYEGPAEREMHVEPPRTIPRNDHRGFSNHPRNLPTLAPPPAAVNHNRPSPHVLPSQIKHAFDHMKRSNTDDSNSVRKPFHPPGRLPPPLGPAFDPTHRANTEDTTMRMPFHPPGRLAFTQGPPSGARFPGVAPNPGVSSMPRFPMPGMAAQPANDWREAPTGQTAPARWKPPTAAKPPPHRPQPPLPSHAEPIHVTNAVGQGGEESDDEEDWTYEPLPQYNIYSV